MLRNLKDRIKWILISLSLFYAVVIILCFIITFNRQDYEEFLVIEGIIVNSVINSEDKENTNYKIKVQYEINHINYTGEVIVDDLNMLGPRLNKDNGEWESTTTNMPIKLFINSKDYFECYKYEKCIISNKMIWLGSLGILIVMTVCIFVVNIIIPFIKQKYLHRI